MNLSSILFAFIAMGTVSCQLKEMEGMVSSVLPSTSTHTPSPVAHVMHHKHGVPILQTELRPEERLFWEAYSADNYFNHPLANKSALLVHTAVMLVTVIFVYPIALVFKNLGRWRLYSVALCLHSVLVFVSLLRYSQFMRSVPDLYPHNAYNTMSWILLWSTLVQLISFFVLRATGMGEGYHVISSDASDASGRSVDAHSDEFELSTFTGTENFNLTPFPKVRQSNRTSFSGSDTSQVTRSSSHSDAHDDRDAPLGNSNVDLFNAPQVHKFSSRLGSMYVRSGRLSELSRALHGAAFVAFNFLHWAHFFYFLVYIPTGVATFLLLGQGNTVFGLLAHFIKGGVFVAYGILSLSRYCGVFENKGWAWNHKFYTSEASRWGRMQPSGLVTMEMLESVLILFYGSTNVFLEHLANPGGEWSPKDLQHASIAFIFIGCGLSGVVTEYQLTSWRFETGVANYNSMREGRTLRTTGAPGGADEDIDLEELELSIMKASPGYSANPFPVLTIYWTGILMSQHEQSSETSTRIHQQWGNLFVLACCFRFFTYAFKILDRPQRSLTQPSRPMSELVVSFALICGGLIFMESCEPMVLRFEWYGLDSMFTLNVSLGVTALLMGWQMSVFCFKDWLKSGGA